MATMLRLSSAFVMVILLTVCYGQQGFSRFLGNVEPCTNICENTYSPHTYDKALHLSYCRRGCRLFTILDFIHEDVDLNKTREYCTTSCQEAYQTTEDQAPCMLGCNTQVPYALKHHSQELHQPQTAHIVYPFMYVRTMYSNMVNSVHRTFSVNWQYYMDPEKGRVIVIRSEPSVLTQNVDSSSPEYKTMNYLESNLISKDNSATPNLKSSQIRSMDEANFAAEDSNQDWLSCISTRTGLPRIFLSFTLFLSAVVMIWLCFTTAATAPDHYVKSQKLSIYGDLDYLKDLQKKGISSITPQEKAFYAPPLPVKIKVDQI